MFLKMIAMAMLAIVILYACAQAEVVLMSKD